MSLFSNQNFMNQIVHESGCTNIPEDTIVMLQTLVEIETRKLIQLAGKFARNSRRDQIDFEDVESACSDIGHPEITFINQEEQYVRYGSSYIRRDPVYKSAKELIEEELKSLSTNLSSAPKLRAHWVYIDGKIPKTNDNRMLKSKTEILTIREKELGEKNKKFNIIMDQPESMLTGLELEYYREVTNILSDSDCDIAKLEDIDVSGNLSNLLPLFLKYLLDSPITDVRIIFLIALLDNQYIRSSLEFHLHQILTYLCAYEGDLSFQVGQKLGEIIKRFSHKYPYLCNIWVEAPNPAQALLNQESRNSAYHNTVKKIAIEISTGIQVDIPNQLIEKMEEDAVQEIRAAMLCKQTVTEYAGRISCLREITDSQLHWIPNQYDLQNEKYMMMGL